MRNIELLMSAHDVLLSLLAVLTEAESASPEMNLAAARIGIEDAISALERELEKTAIQPDGPGHLH